jgi:hypothetical protein
MVTGMKRSAIRDTFDSGSTRGSAALKLFLSTLLVLILGAAPASAVVEQCRFIQAKPEREACYQRQEKELAAKRKPEPAADTSTAETLQQMRQEDEALYRSMRGICRGC